jgi:hypothetical protein
MFDKCKYLHTDVLSAIVRSEMYKFYDIGNNNDPCGTSGNIGLCSEYSPTILALNGL